MILMCPRSAVIAAIAASVMPTLVVYVYDIMVHAFSNTTQAVAYRHGVCDTVTCAESYARVTGDVKKDSLPNHKLVANYLVSHSVNLLCSTQKRTLACSIGA